MGIEAAHRQARGAHDALHARALEAVLAEERLGRGEDARVGRLLVLGSIPHALEDPLEDPLGRKSMQVV